MQSSNPAMAVVTREAGQINFGGLEQAATVSGTTTKSLVLIAITMVTGYLAMDYTTGYIAAQEKVPGLLIYGSLIAALVVAVVTVFRPQYSPYTAPAYAILEGLALGSLSSMFELRYPGIVSTAVLSTFVVVMVMLALWKFRVIVPTARFRSVVTGATAGVFVLYMIHMVMGLFGLPLLPSTGPLAIGISLLVCTLAAFNLVLDFQNIQDSCDQGLPRYFEYFNGFSLLVTICWLYIEILRLLSMRE